jgi:hypothetical protein
MAANASYGGSAQSFPAQYVYLVRNVANPAKLSAEEAGKYGINQDGQ